MEKSAHSGRQKHLLQSILDIPSNKEALMKRHPNVGVAERRWRFIAGCALFLVATAGGFSWPFVLSLYFGATVLTVTALSGHCPLYHFTRSGERKGG